MNTKDNLSSPIVHDAPVRSKESDQYWGSDAIAAVLRNLDIPYVALNPGASYRGLHDSIVNYLGNRSPQMLLSIHDENAVAIAPNRQVLEELIQHSLKQGIISRPFTVQELFARNTHALTA